MRASKNDQKDSKPAPVKRTDGASRLKVDDATLAAFLLCVCVGTAECSERSIQTLSSPVTATKDGVHCISKHTVNLWNSKEHTYVRVILRLEKENIFLEGKYGG